MKLGHVAVVSQVLTDRIIQVTHANWSVIDGERGKIEQNVTVVDVSAQRRLDPGQGLVRSGARPRLHHLFDLRVHLPGRGPERPGRPARTAAFTVAQTTVNQLAAAVQPSGSPVQSFAKDSTDRIAALISSVMNGDSSPNN
ncbi:MAG: hypothetical protein WDM92_12300 [Caulobacteraceae bacterium]